MCKRFFFILLAAPLFSELPLQNLSLQDAEVIALEYNKSFLIAQESSFQADERKAQAISRFLPSIGYRAEFRDIEKKELFFDVFSSHFVFSHRGYSSIFQLSQPIFSTDLLFGLKTSHLKAQVYSHAQANTKNELLLAVRDRYYSVLFYEKALEIERENIDYLAYALEQIQGKMDAGSSTPFEVNQSKAAVANAISLYYETLKDLKNARNALVISLGIDPLLEPEICLAENAMPIHKIPEIEIKLLELEQMVGYSLNDFPTTEDYLKHIDTLEYAQKLILFSPKEVQEYLDLALSSRPDLQAKKIEIDVASQNVNQKLGTYLPKISGYVRTSYNDIDLGTKPFFQQDYNWSVGVVFSWNLFDSFLREHEIKEARSVRSSSKISYDKEWQRIEVEIRNGLYLLEEAMLTYSSATQAVLVAEQARDQAKDKLAFGRIAPLEYRDSVNQLAQARNQKNQASYDLIAAYYQIRFATGIDAQ